MMQNEVNSKNKIYVEDLKRIKESLKGHFNLKDGTYRVKITVHMGTCGIAAGAQKIFDAIQQKLVKSQMNDVILSTSGCAGLCNHEPMITVETKGSAPVKYIKLDPEKAGKIFDDHVSKGDPVVKYALCVGCETTY
jgi:NADP-reducing hydrogenase subunit HndB